jgi:hypothetical protein
MKLKIYNKDVEKRKERSLFTHIPIFGSDAEERKTVAFDS